MLRLFNPNERAGLSSKMSVPEFFTDWYVSEINRNRSRRPVSDSTIERRRDAINAWETLMASPVRPNGPLLDEICEDTLFEFREKLKTHTYSRGGFRRYPLADATQETLFREFGNVYAAAGPKQGNSRIRAGVLDDTSRVYVEPAMIPPRRLWTVDEARLIAKQIDSLIISDNSRKPVSVDRLRCLMRATVALWAYTGCRAKSIMTLKKSDVHEISEGISVLMFRERKTSKTSTIPIHHRLRLELQSVMNLFPKSDLLVPWHFQYRQVAKLHDQLLEMAKLPDSARKPPNYWRKWFASAMEQAGLEHVQSLSTGMLNHSSQETTKRYYSNAASVVITCIPDIFQDE